MVDSATASSTKQRLVGKAAVITGAASGIGEATARRFVADGAQVLLFDINAEVLRATTERLQALGDVEQLVGDVTVAADVDTMISKSLTAFGRIDAFVNSAATCWPIPLFEITREAWDRTIMVNLTSNFFAAQAVAKTMCESASGSIINVASTAALSAEANISHYGASKAGVIAFTKCMAVELGGHGVRVNVVAPGYIDTPMTQSYRTPERLREVVRSTPLGRVGEPDEVAAACSFLASDDASFISGACLVVDGCLFKGW